MEDWMHDALSGAVRSAWEQGCPVAGGDPEMIATFADRRMRSFDRRMKKSSGRLARIDDLGKGLAQHFGDATAWSSPLKEDLRYLAKAIFDAASDVPWDRAQRLFPTGSAFTSVVHDVQRFGVLVQLPDTEVLGLVKVPDLFPLHSGRPEPNEWPSVGSKIGCSVISHGDGRHRIDLRPNRYRSLSGEEIFHLDLHGVNRDQLPDRLREVFRLDPPLASGRSWDAISDSISGGLMEEDLARVSLWVTGISSLDDVDSSSQTFRAVLESIAKDLRQSPPIGSQTEVRLLTD